MSQETGAGMNTASHALTNYLFEDPSGRIPLVAPEVSANTAGYPNPALDGAQPETLTPSDIEGAPINVYTAKHAAAVEPLVTNPGLADAHEWSARYQHVPETEYGWTVKYEDALGKIDNKIVKPDPTPIGGEIKNETLRYGSVEPAPIEMADEVSDELLADDTPTEVITAGHELDDTLPGVGIDDILPSLDEPQQRGRTRWYNPADFARALHIKMRPELWTRRTNAAVLAGSIAMTAVGAVMAYYGAKHGGGHQITHELWGVDTNSPTHPHTPIDAHTTPTTPQHTDVPFAPEHHAPVPEHPAQPTPQPEHFRTAVGYDHDTHRASTATDWSRDAIERAGKGAGLSRTQIDKLVHDQHNINQVNHALYADNGALAKDHHHLLNAHERYNVTGQDTAARDIVKGWKTEHTAVDAGTATQAETSGSTTAPKPLSNEEINRQLRDIEKELKASDPSITAAAPQSEHDPHGITGDEIAALSVVGGAIAVGGVALVYKARHRANVTRSRTTEWGGTRPHREGTYNGRHYAPSVPAGTNPYEYWAFERRVKEEKEALATV